ncbi:MULTISPECIES: helix-turn-helix transcriptional regulator [Cetobacterium]|jgi:CBS domain-containing protein|uniref:Helix-turn-helix transcriptional regulator n=1 Tax=Candidatus Cetobacterium colombiensis TaxID=3073100 RepID=A0ABU4WA27_9FUSO|nr:helix-turn-helix transcriptional regulator [Candidatus Cetobacterium colombiensis]MDX8336389.1 helix-turn-helix transcriptional regulator [Candidatus Cetobacterium colombiensis]
MQLTERQKEIVEIIKKHGPITGDEIAKMIYITRSALRTDFSILKKMSIIKSKQKVGYTYNEAFVESNNKTLVKHIMGMPITIDEGYSVYKTVLLMFEKDIGTIFITKDGNLSGIVSRKDLLRIAIGKRDIEQIPINLIMTRMPNVVFATEEETIENCVKKIIEHQIDSVPVVRITGKSGKENYKVVGRFTKTNVSKLMLDILENKNKEKV